MRGNRQTGRLAALCLGSLLLMSGCTDIKRAVGIEKVSPDEFAVESRAPLTIPPEFDLRPPAPGAPRPQETSVASKAQGVIDNAGPGDPGKQAAGVLKFPGARPGGVSQDPAAQALASNLLQFNGAGATVEKRETAPLRVY